ncbi:MAG: GNAT family N-acetyltransferase [Lentimicrobium sp.]
MSKSIDLKLYRIEASSVEPIIEWPEYFMGYKLVVYKPDLFNLGKYDSNMIVNLLWYVITLGRVYILYLFDNETIVHSCYFTSKTFRFGYMSKNDINLGQATTNPEYRGKGIMTNVLKLIFAYHANKCEYLWGYCDVVNLASQKAIEKAGFKFVCYAKMNTLTKIVRLVDKL